MPTKILVVEDQADIRLMTRIMLEWSGYEVIEARDGYEALLSAEKHCPDVILMDIGMPIMDGVRSAELIRATKNCGATPIIAVTAFDNEYLESLGNFRFHHIIRKPIEREHLQQILNDIAPPSA